VRRTELTRLKVGDIDSRRMVVHIQGGKGRQDRDVMLSPVLLEELRAHCVCFPGFKLLRIERFLLFEGRSAASGQIATVGFLGASLGFLATTMLHHQAMSP
jgi:integrase